MPKEWLKLGLDLQHFIVYLLARKKTSSVSYTSNHSFSKSKKPCVQNILLCVINFMLIPGISEHVL